MNKQILSQTYMLLLAVGYLGVSCGQQVNQHLKRGDDWIKLQDYTQAASEYRQAVTDEPANAEAHVGLIKSLIGLGRYEDAVKEIDLIRKLEPSTIRATDLARSVEDSIVKAIETFLNTPRDSSRTSLMGSAVFEGEVDNLFNNLELLRKIGSAQSVPLLKSLMGSPATRMAAKAESVLQDLSPSDVSMTLDTLLASPNAEVKTRTARRLWKDHKNEKAGRVLLSAAEVQLTTAGKVATGNLSYEANQALAVGFQNLDELGYDLAKDFYKRILSNIRLYNWELTTACLKKVIGARDLGMKETVVKMIRDNYANVPPQELIRGSPWRPALDYLAECRDKTFLPEVKAALGYYFPSGDQTYCPSIIALLKSMDGMKWEAFSYWYSGWPEFHKLNLDMNRKRGDWGGSGKPVVDDSPEDAASVDRLFATLGPMSGLSGGARELKVSKVDVMDADRIKWICSIRETRSESEISEAELIFRGTGDKERAWVLTKVENLRPKVK